MTGQSSNDKKGYDHANTSLFLAFLGGKRRGSVGVNKEGVRRSPEMLGIGSWLDGRSFRATAESKSLP